jgi:choline dehydrogenase-like flavoprotein
LHTDFGVGVDWPIGYCDLAPYYDEIERFLGVSGPSPYPWGPPRRLTHTHLQTKSETSCGTMGVADSPSTTEVS